MISIAILKSSSDDDIQIIAANKLKEMILTNVKILVNQLDSDHDIKDLMQVIVTNRQELAEKSGMVFVLSDIFHQQKTQELFDQVNTKAKILIDLNFSENIAAHTWKCGTYTSNSVKSCFESGKNMTTKEMLIKVLYNHNKKNNHYETRTLLLSALALGVECYDGKNNSEFCQRLMNAKASQVVTKAYDYDMEKRSIASSIATGISWVTKLISTVNIGLQAYMFGGNKGHALLFALASAAAISVTVSILPLIVWLKREGKIVRQYMIMRGNQSGPLSKLWDYLNYDLHTNIDPLDNDELDEPVITVQNDDTAVIAMGGNAAKMTAIINRLVEKAKLTFLKMSSAFTWLLLSLLFKVPLWISIYNLQIEKWGLMGIINISWWIRILKTADLAYEQFTPSANYFTAGFGVRIKNHTLGTLSVSRTIFYGTLAMCVCLSFLYLSPARLAAGLLMFVFPSALNPAGIHITVEQNETGEGPLIERMRNIYVSFAVPNFSNQRLDRIFVRQYFAEQQARQMQRIANPKLIVSSRALEHLKTKIYDKEIEDDICAICHDLDVVGWVKLDCKHEFHYECIFTWLEKNITCPTCRNNVKLSLESDALN